VQSYNDARLSGDMTRSWRFHKHLIIGKKTIL